VMVLDHSGPDLAMILYASALKLGIFASVILGILMPAPRAGGVAGIIELLAGLVALGVVVGLIESVMARLRLPKVPLYIAAGSATGLFALILLLR
jgi:formate hydrogenlyase subunit 4